MKVEIVNWEKYNPRPRYDVKSASWFRCQNNFVTDPDFFDLSNDQKMIWIYLCCEASAKMAASIKINPNLIASILKVDATVVRSTLEAYENTGLIKCSPRTSSESAANPPRVRGESAASPPEKAALRNGTERNERNEHKSPPTEDSSEPAGFRPTPRDLASLWNELRAPAQPAVNLALLKPGSRRWTWAKARLGDNPDLDYWRQVVGRIAKSSFCRGENNRRDGAKPWIASLDFLLRPDTHIKAMEGQYDDPGAVSEQSLEDRCRAIFGADYEAT